MDSELLLIAVTTINGYVSQNTDTACYYTKNHFLKFIHLLVGGNISQLVYLTPHPRFWSSDCLHILKWLWSITLLKMMKISYNPDIFCLFTLISHLKYLRWWVGGNLSQLVYLAPHSDFLSSDWLWILNCCLLLLQLLMDMFRKIQILPASIQKPISWNSSIYWWGATYPSWFILPRTHDGWGATYPSWFILPPTQIFEQWMAMGSELLLITFQLLMDMFHKIQILPAGIQKPISWNSPWYRWGATIPAGLPYPPPKILEQGLFTHNEITLKYYIT